MTEGLLGGFLALRTGKRIETLVPNSALVFSLYFWIDMTQSGLAQVASDLRFMIDKAFPESGISMAFPQRDMHLTSDAPLSIRIVRKPAGEAGEEAKELP